MGRKAKAGLGWLLLLGLPLAWCSSGDDKRQSTPRMEPAPTSYITPPAPRNDPAPTRKTQQQPTFLLPQAALGPAPATPPASEPTKPSSVNRATGGTYFTTSKVNMRAGPSTSTDVVARIDAGEAILSFGTAGKWHDVRYGHLNGWVHGDFLTAEEPRPAAPQAISPSSASRYSAFGSGSSGGSGDPLRSPYTGRCECPYDYKRNGHRCGGSSAYSRPGGHKPKCYD